MVKLIKKNSKGLLDRRLEHGFENPGFFGRVLPLCFDGKYCVLRHIPGTPKDEMSVVFSEFEVGSTHLESVKQLFFHKYGMELVKVKNVAKFADGSDIHILEPLPKKQIELWER